MKRILYTLCFVFIISLLICIPTLTLSAAVDHNQISISSATANFTVNLDDNETMTITPDSPLKDGDVKYQYSQELQVHSGSGSYTWALQKGSKLPSGLKLKAVTLDSSKATLSGKPAKAVDNYSFTVQVTDKTTGIVAVKPYQIHINPAVILVVPKSPPLEAGVAFPEWIPTASGGDDNFTWSITKGELPDELDLNTSTGAITGTPQTSNSIKVTLTVADSIGGSASKALTFKVLSGLEIKTLTLPSADIDVAYKASALKAEGGKKPYKWSVLEETGEGGLAIQEGFNSLPPGFILSDKGVITGTPEVGSSGTYKFKVVVKDSLGVDIQGMAVKDLSLTINEPLSISTNIPSNGYLGDVCSYTLNPGGGSGSGYKWKLSGKAPTGLKITSVKVDDNTTYAIAGTLKKEGTFIFTLKLTDSLKGFTTQQVNFKVFGSRPKVVSVTPQDNAIDVAVDTAVTAVFSQEMDYLTISASSFTLKAGDASIPASVSYNSDTKTAALVPESDLANSTVYTADLTTDIKGSNGSSLANLKTWTFKTIDDLIPPEVISVTPINQADEVDFDAVVQVEFSEAVDPATLSSDSFTLMRDGKIVQGTVEPTSGSDNKGATFKPKEKLFSHTIYTAEVTSDITDAVGNPLAAAYSWSFTTRTSDTLVSLKSPSSVEVNDEFTVEVQINNVTDLNTCQFQVNFNNSIIELDSTEYFDGIEYGQVGSIVFEPSIWTIETGSIRWTAELPSNVSASGQGYLLKLHFKALKAGQSTFVFTDEVGVPGKEDFFNKLFDTGGQIIPFEKTNWQITVTAH